MTLTYRLVAGSTQVEIKTFADLVEAVQIPETQWVATSAPTSTLVADPAFLALLDSDQNGRVRVDEVQAAVVWTKKMLKDGKGADEGSDVVVLSRLSDDAARLKAAAELILSNLGEADVSKVSLAQLRAAQPKLRAAGKNGDGIVASKHLPEKPEKVRALADQIAALFAETKNRGGDAGLSVDNLKAFRDARTAMLAHLEKRTAVFAPLADGGDALARAQRIDAVRSRIDEHFLLCRLVASQPDARERFRLAAATIEGLVGDRAGMEKALASLPIAAPDPSGVIAWGTLLRGPSFELLSSFAKEIAGPLLKSNDQLTEAAWRDLTAKADAVLGWQKEHDANLTAKIAADLKAMKDADLDVIAKAQTDDLAQKEKLDDAADLEKLALFQRWLLNFANSFLSVPDLYSKKRALFERGWGVLAGRRYNLSVLVPDMGAHRAQTEQGTTCVVYCRIEDKAGGATYDVALPKTRGWSTELAVGKRGLFYDVDNVEHDAVVTHIVRHPVSVVEAALTPFLRLGTFINTKLEGLGGGVDDAMAKQTAVVGSAFDKTATGATAALKAAPTLPAPTAAPAPAPTSAPTPAPAATQAGPGNALAMGGFAVAAIGSSIAFVVAQLKALNVGDVLQIVMTLFAAVAIPSGFVGWLKLRRRNLAQLLEGAGWALNDRLKMTAPLAAMITKKPARLAGSKLEVITLAIDDDDAPEEGLAFGWKLAIFVVLVGMLAWKLKDPVLRAGCHENAVPAAVCAAFEVPAGVDHEPSP